jgi:hypothetical protein
LIQTKLQLLAVALSGGLFLIILELVRRRRLMERYSLLWLLSAATLLVLAVWKGLLQTVSHAIGIHTASNALFAIAFGFVLLLLIHFSLVISRLADQNKVLAQKIGLLEHRLRRQEARGEAAADPAAQAEREREPGELTRFR